MSNNPYNKHFKSMRGSSEKKKGLTVSEFEKQLEAKQDKKKADEKAKKEKKIPWKLGGLSILGVILTAYGYLYYEEVEKFITRIEVQGISRAFSQEKPKSNGTAAAAKAGAKSESGSQEPGAAPAEEASPVGPAENSAKKDETNEVLNHLTKLQDKKKELDQREAELSKNEAELSKQRDELEKQLKALEETRKKISTVLDDKIKADNEKIDSLVQMYTSMKPPQAAKVIESMDEDLAVEILARMKRKTAAEIMNIVKPEKAQVLTEKFAGYKKK